MAIELVSNNVTNVDFKESRYTCDSVLDTFKEGLTDQVKTYDDILNSLIIYITGEGKFAYAVLEHDVSLITELLGVLECVKHDLLSKLFAQGEVEYE